MNNTFLTARLEVLLRDFKSFNIYSKRQCQKYLGSLFRGYLPITDYHSDEEAGAMLIRRYLFVHVESFPDKLECLLHMLRKLFAFVQGYHYFNTISVMWVKFTNSYKKLKKMCCRQCGRCDESRAVAARSFN